MDEQRKKPSGLETLGVMAKDIGGPIYDHVLAPVGRRVGKTLKELGRGFAMWQLVTTFNKEGYDLGCRISVNKKGYDFSMKKKDICLGAGIASVPDAIIPAGGIGFLVKSDHSFIEYAGLTLLAVKVTTNVGSLVYQWYKSAQKRAEEPQRPGW